MKDDRIDVLSPQVWVLDGATSNTLYEYANEDAVDAGNAMVYSLPYTCEGTNNVVYQNALFCNVYNTRYVMKFKLSTQEARLVELPDAGVTPGQDEYSNGGGYMDFSVDENGLWVLFASVADQHEISIGKLDPVAMNISRYYFTDFTRNLAGNAFMSCGAMYVIDSATDVDTYIRYTFDTNNNIQQHLGPNDIPFHHLRHAECDNLYGDITMVEYSNREQKLHVWNCKRMEKYDITFQSNY
ncbi:unnamed protein product [Owenia fusiformis]|uniref:Uncharacterized protein n=1 Tax=Owenia fusiformis TaxID=6347 RepID=A0A8J1UH71_OWEFU|nr:unnamed protein product [Owenia fusiformis]